MPEQLRALFVILFLATIVFVFSKKTASPVMGGSNFTRRRNLWLSLTAAAFLAPSFWIYTLIAVPLLIYANRNETNPPAMFFFILFALPVATIQIPGMGLINYVFELSHARLIALLVLFPAFLNLLRQSNNPSFLQTNAGRVFAAYLLLLFALNLRESNLTSAARFVFYLFIDIFLPYYVVSNSLKNIQAFRDALQSFVIAILVVALLAIFESYKFWLLYSSWIHALNLQEGMTGYLGRDGMLRVSVTAGQPIALGYVMVVAIGFYLFLQRSFQQKFLRRLGLGLLVAGLIAPLSRGPWVGAAALLLVFVATGPKPMRKLMSMALAAMLALPLIAMLPGGQRAINLLPFIGTTEKGSIDYREDLLKNSMIVIQRNPWFGSVDFLNTPEMEAMRQGQGIIDIVNSYIAVTLKTGFVGLGLFIGFFALVVVGIYRAMRLLPDKHSEDHLLGRALLATMISILVIITTVSSISIVPIVYWSVAGLGVAYANMVRKQVKEQAQNLHVT